MQYLLLCYTYAYKHECLYLYKTNIQTIKGYVIPNKLCFIINIILTLKLYKMKKIVISLCISFIFSAMGSTVFAQAAGSGPDALALNVYVDSEPAECPGGGLVEGSISAYSGTWFPANPANYGGPGYYYLYVPNCYLTVGLAHASAKTDTYSIGYNGSKWCHGGEYDSFNLPTNPLEAIHFDMELELIPNCED